MKYQEFKKKVIDLPVISSRQINALVENKAVLKLQISKWRTQGLILRLKKGLYILNDTDRRIMPSRTFIANQLVSPSYVSMEYALNFYGLIPERVEEITSITTKKTTYFENSLGRFRYQHIKEKGYFGFKRVRENNSLSFFIAEPEKAIVDFCYLNLKNFAQDIEGVFLESYRLQNFSDLKKSYLKKYASAFQRKKLSDVIDALCNLIDKGE